MHALCGGSQTARTKKVLYSMYAAVSLGTRPAAPNLAASPQLEPAGSQGRLGEEFFPRPPRRSAGAHRPRVTCQGLAPRPTPGSPRLPPRGGAQGWDGCGWVTCEAGESGNAVRDRELLEVGGQLHLHDAGHAVQDHPAVGVRCPAAALA